MKKILIMQPGQQCGYSMFDVLTTIVGLVCILTLGLKILPVYIDHEYVKREAQALVTSGRASTLTLAQIRQEIGTTLRINNVKNFDLGNITVSRDNNVAMISIQYERRVPLVGNLDVVMSFDDRLR